MRAEADENLDGRRARRERGRIAVGDAMVDLVFEGHAPPTAEQVAERAGVSIASLFRYFATLDDLREETTSRYFERTLPLFEVPDAGVGTLAERIDHLVDARLELYEATAPMCRLVRARALDHAPVGERLSLVRATTADQVRLHFDTELAQLTRATADDVAATVTMVTSFESWDHFRTDRRRSRNQTRRAWQRTLLAVLTQPNNTPNHQESSQP